MTLDAAQVAAEILETEAEDCPAEHAIRMGDPESDVTLRCAVKPAAHPPPHRDPSGLAWDDSVVTRAWPSHAAAWIVRELIDAAGPLLLREGPADPDALARWHAACEAAELLPGVGGG